MIYDQQEQNTRRKANIICIAITGAIGVLVALSMLNTQLAEMIWAGVGMTAGGILTIGSALVCSSVSHKKHLRRMGVLFNALSVIGMFVATLVLALLNPTTAPYGIGKIMQGSSYLAEHSGLAAYLASVVYASATALVAAGIVGIAKAVDYCLSNHCPSRSVETGRAVLRVNSADSLPALVGTQTHSYSPTVRTPLLREPRRVDDPRAEDNRPSAPPMSALPLPTNLPRSQYQSLTLAASPPDRHIGRLPPMVLSITTSARSGDAAALTQLGVVTAAGRAANTQRMTLNGGSSEAVYSYQQTPV